ncbi:MAG: alanine--tRNA ligase [Dehalococcoidales bacterium]
MTGDEIRAAFLSFFEEKGHRVIPSSSLIPHGDPTLLLTSAGMVQFKPYFLGEAVPPSPRLASCQKCFRTTDIEAVGDTSHLTFFEMLGNFSIGDYFKKEAIGWAWQFVTRRLGLPPQRLWVTVFLDDDESFGIWRELGVAEDRILRFGEEENYWGPAGDTGPCGPCSEIHYDFGPEHGCGQPSCAPNCECGRFSEIWNLVFIQYNQDKKGHRSLLPKPSIDTGMGLERTAAVMQGRTSVYETDLFSPLIEDISRLSGNKYGADDSADNNMRVIAEHGRGIAFLIADGVMPSNEGRGYVLRRLLRRAALSGRRLALDKPFLAEIARATIKKMGPVYPELIEKQDFVLKVIKLEEARFAETLSTGLELLDSIMAQASSQVRSKITGKQAFKLYDTYGFPVELTQEVAQKQGFSVDLEGFEAEMEKQRQKAREAHKFELAEEIGLKDRLDIKDTLFIGYSNLKNKTIVVGLMVDNEDVATVKEGQKAGLILEATPFYAEMGGQVGDTGKVIGSSGRFSVTNAIRVAQDLIVHQGHVIEGSLTVGDEVTAEVDRERRLDIARNHTATHLLQSALRRVLGEHVQQRGSLVTPDRLRFDFSHLSAVTKEEIDETQRIVNARIRQNLAVYDQNIPYKQAIEAGAIALFDEKYGDTVRVLKIGQPPISIELCGGTHIAATGEIGLFQIITEAGIGAGLRRIEAATGRGAEEVTGQKFDALRDKASSTLAELGEEKKRTRTLEREIGRMTAGGLLLRGETVNGIKLIAEKVPPSRIEVLRDIADLLREQLKSGIIVLGTVYEGSPIFLAAVTPDLVKKGYHAGEIIKKVAGITGGSGGGKATLAQGGGKDKSKLDEAIRLVKSLI